MKPDEYRAALAQAMPEKELLAAVTRIAKGYSWLTYHTHRSQHSPAGFPDLTLVHRGADRLLFAELKRERRGKRDDPTPAQVEWLDALGGIAAIAYDTDERPLMHVHLWRPSDLLDGTIERILRVSE